MGTDDVLIIELSPKRKPLPTLPPTIRRTRPRDYIEWKTLRRWGKLPYWEAIFPGYLLREAREAAGLTQKQMAERLGCSQQAVARAERPTSNPTFAFLQVWADAVRARLEISLTFEPPATARDPSGGASPTP